MSDEPPPDPAPTSAPTSTPISAPVGEPQAGPTGARGLPRLAQSRSLVGSFDAIDHGYEAGGWVFDLAQPGRICTVELRIDGQPVAQVAAGLPRPDLAPFRIRPDCGFRITVPAALFDGMIRTAEVLVLPEALRIGAPRPLAAVILDHTSNPKTASVDSILQLRDGALDYDRIFPIAFLQRHGVRAAVAYGYIWLLKRPPDRPGWDSYAGRILAGELSLGGFLRNLAASEEAQRAHRTGLDLATEFEAVVAAAALLPPETRGGR